MSVISTMLMAARDTGRGIDPRQARAPQPSADPRRPAGPPPSHPKPPSPAPPPSVQGQDEGAKQERDRQANNARIRLNSARIAQEAELAAARRHIFETPMDVDDELVAAADQGPAPGQQLERRQDRCVPC